MVDKDIEKANSSLIRTQDIFTELMVSLDTTQGEWTKQMLSIYEFIKRQLVQANLKKDVKIMDEIIPLIEDVSNLWHDAYKEAKRQG
ncbi:flagellar biosynthetic protein FliS [Clostridium saccharoperbutylacetonicum]|nr:flagellar biosynthetic protein FliS [Clostridium saccharoperbutylacetonicum]